jgi:hypothetical protein
MLGSENLHSVGRNVIGLASSTNNVIARYDGITGGIVQDSSILIDDTNNLSGAKSITFTLSAANPGTGGTLWYNAGSSVMNIGSAKIVNATASQTLTNTAPIISSVRVIDFRFDIFCIRSKLILGLVLGVNADRIIAQSHF